MNLTKYINYANIISIRQILKKPQNSPIGGQTNDNHGRDSVFDHPRGFSSDGRRKF